ncbi:MASE1 domain-containing protein [Sulfitobacter delicatus]|uniref:histidine kinase n=1 Tax=Sulfitobacter delicatus TaxID=218672 RepID=A0A1G7TNX0_9RHOB|nr:MASE1 domain-containing protein [Sulfitobacter delicatus]SDG37027.1 PAS domain S-box-containing protein [Sulfitobacter delicatus]
MNVSSGKPASAKLLVFYVVYVASMAFGRWVLAIPDIPIVVWPPNGVLLAILLTQPKQIWPWWVGFAALGELTGNAIWFHNPVGWALAYIAANAMAVVLAASLLRTNSRISFRFDRLSHVLKFLVICVLLAPGVSATLGSAIDAFVGKNPFTTTWPLWWLGDATGILIATPLVVSFMNAWNEKAWPQPMKFIEAAAIAVVLSLLSAWVLSRGATYAFILPMPIIWAALRFEFRGASFAVLVLTIAIAVHAQNFEHLPLSIADLVALQSKLKALILVAATIGLIVAGVARQQKQALEDLALANDRLEERVAERTHAIEAAERRFKATFENAGVGMSIVGPDGKLLRVNDSLARMLGRDVKEMEGHGIEEFTHPDDRALIEVAWAKLTADGMDEYEQEKRYLDKAEKAVWGHTTVSCVRHEDGTIAYLIKVIQDITERKRSEALRQLLMREVNHRSKNLLALVQVIARQTAKHSSDNFLDKLNERLQALAANQDILVHNEWTRVALSDLVAGQLTHFEAVADRVHLSGPPILLPPAAAQALGMAVHELATNAGKYGSLSNEDGQVDISWAVENESFHIIWRECGGPPVAPPERKGFGTTVLQKMAASTMSGEVSLDYSPKGFVWELSCPMTSLQESNSDDRRGATG